MRRHQPPHNSSAQRWRVLMWNLGWWLPFLPARVRKWLFARVSPPSARR